MDRYRIEYESGGKTVTEKMQYAEEAVERHIALRELGVWSEITPIFGPDDVMTEKKRLFGRYRRKSMAAREILEVAKIDGTFYDDEVVAPLETIEGAYRTMVGDSDLWNDAGEYDENGWEVKA